MRNNKQKIEAISKLNEQKDGIQEFSIFGDNNHDAYDAAIEVIANDVFDLEEIYNLNYESHVEELACAACDWLNEEIELPELLGE